MKIKFLLSLVVLTLLFSCSSDTVSGSDSSTQTNYFPLALTFSGNTSADGDLTVATFPSALSNLAESGI